jgi:hypothetical protein
VRRLRGNVESSRVKDSPSVVCRLCQATEKDFVHAGFRLRAHQRDHKRLNLNSSVCITTQHRLYAEQHDPAIMLASELASERPFMHPDGLLLSKPCG